MKNNKILIGYNYELEAHEQRQIALKDLAKKSLLQYVTNVCKLMPTDDFTEGDILSHFKTLFLAKWKDKLPEGIEYDRMLYLASVDYNKLVMLVDEFNRVEVSGQMDFGIYATTPQQMEQFKALAKVCEAVHSSQNHLPCKIFFGNLVQAFNGALRYDHRDNKLKPHAPFILNLNSRI